MKIIILAGGGGTRLWPLSRPQWPKQFLSLDGSGISLLGDTIRRCMGPGISLTDIHIVTGAALQTQVAEQLKDMGLEAIIPNIIAEPMRRNTAPAIALAAQFIFEECKNTGEVLAVLPADHAFADAAAFRSQLQEAERLAARGHIVTLGIRPDRPETGYGYIEVADTGAGAGWMPVSRFVEKPDHETACRYVESGRYFWNAGIFLMTVGTLLESLDQHAPGIRDLLRPGYAHAYRRFGEMPDISVDYAVMEKAENIVVMPLRSAWSDLGCWDNVHEMLAKDEAGNALRGENMQVVDTAGCLVWSETDRHIATVGLDDCLVIDTPDALLVARKGRSQDVKHVTKGLESGRFHVSDAPLLRQTSWGSLQQLSDASEPALCRVQILPGQSLAVQADADIHWCVQAGNGSWIETSLARLLNPVEHWNQAAGSRCHLFAGKEGLSLIAIGGVPVCEAVVPEFHPNAVLGESRQYRDVSLINGAYQSAYNFVKKLSQLSVF